MNYNAKDNMSLEHLLSTEDWSEYFHSLSKTISFEFDIYNGNNELIAHSPQYSLQLRDWKTGNEVRRDDYRFKNPTKARKVNLKDLQGMSELPDHFKKGGTQ